MHRSRIIMTVVASLAILGAGVGAAVLLVKNGPEAAKQQSAEPVTGVRVFIVEVADVPVSLATQGVVEADRVTVLASEVGGRVIEVAAAFEAGGFLAADELMLRIDPADYRAAVAAAEAAVASAEEQLAIEQARAEQGRRDWERLGRGGAPDELVLRVPQLARASSSLESAKASLERARRDLERTEVRAPYACRVRAARVDLGSVVAPGSVLGEVTSSGELEVRLPLSLADYGFLRLDAEGQPSGAVVLRGEIGGEPVEWRGAIVRSENEVDRTTLSIYVVAAIEASGDAPAGFRLPPVGMFLRASIEGRSLEGVAALPRTAIHERIVDRGRVFVVEPGEVLGFRDVRIRHSDRETAYVDRGLEPGDRVVMTKIAAPVAGKPLEVLGPAGEDAGVAGGEAEQPAGN